MVSTKDPGGSALERLRQFGLRYPGAHTKSPWPGHLDLAVNDKTFAYLSIAGEPFKVSCKLPRSADAALELPFTTPTAYGLGKSGWVTAEFPDGAGVPVELLEEWIDESYRAQAPKRLSAGLPPFGASAELASPGSAKPRAVKAAAGRGAVKAAGRGVAKAAGLRGGAKAAGPRAVKAAGPRAAKAAKRASPAAVARAGRATKRAGGSQRATKRPAKKRARSAA